MITSKASRWFANLVIIMFNPLSVRLVFPFPVGLALLANERHRGLLNNIDLPYWLEVAMVVAALGPPALAVLIFEVAFNAPSMFNHSNIHIPVAIGRVLRLFLVTPDMHRVHHSVIIRETDRNYGFNLPCWDSSLPLQGRDSWWLWYEFCTGVHVAFVEKRVFKEQRS